MKQILGMHICTHNYAYIYKNTIITNQGKQGGKTTVTKERLDFYIFLFLIKDQGPRAMFCFSECPWCLRVAWHILAVQKIVFEQLKIETTPATHVLSLVCFHRWFVLSLEKWAFRVGFASESTVGIEETGIQVFLNEPWYRVFSFFGFSHWDVWLSLMVVLCDWIPGALYYSGCLLCSCSCADLLWYSIFF